jgi:hypothetical protein
MSSKKLCRVTVYGKPVSPEPQRLPLAPAAARPLPGLAGALIAVEWGSDRAQDLI